MSKFILIYRQKVLAEMASILGKNDIAEKLNKDAEFIKEYVQKICTMKKPAFSTM